MIVGLELSVSVNCFTANMPPEERELIAAAIYAGVRVEVAPVLFLIASAILVKVVS
jgi:hypothetical protein